MADGERAAGGAGPEQRSRVSAYAIAVDGDRLLLTRLSQTSAVFEPGLWHLPGGGVDRGEQPAEALVRELAEETGLPVRAARLVDARSYRAVRDGVDWHLVALFYRVELPPRRPSVRKRDDSTDEVAWFPLSSLDPGRLSVPTADALEMLAPD